VPARLAAWTVLVVAALVWGTLAVAAATAVVALVALVRHRRRIS
jgi:hypothetical protein